MNRIILIGNGFDLAHGLKTSYADFIDWYWKEWGKQLLRGEGRLIEDNLCSFKLSKKICYANWYDIWHFHYVKELQYGPWKEDEVLNIAKQDRNLCDFTIKSPLFEKICDEHEKGWVDIEDIYYDFLKKSDNPKQLNKDLDFIKNKLIEYLNSLSEPTLNPNIRNQILTPFNKEDIAIGSMNLWKEMMKYRLNYKDEEWERLFAGYNPKGTKPYSVSTIQYFKNEHVLDILSGNFININEKICPAYRLPDHILILNFNYTNTANMYLPQVENFSVRHIHGSLSNPKSVIFGYGDEHDDEYQPLMKKNDNEYLRHIKSFRYLEAANYREMLSFIEMDAYQICIMGHSCGISDRTLLKTLFEHKNCVSIKPYYYQKEDGTDNYFDLVCSIARNISNPRLMRDRVVRKERCEALGH